MKLTQVVVAGKKDPEAGKAAAEKVQERLKSGDSPEEIKRDMNVAARVMDYAELGIVALNDLNPDLQEMLRSLDEGDISEVRPRGDTFTIIKIDERFTSSKDPEDLKDEIRNIIEQQKLESRLASFFSVELLKNHIVERKY